MHNVQYIVRTVKCIHIDSWTITFNQAKDKERSQDSWCSRHGFLYIRGWMQMVIAPMIYFPETIDTISTMSPIYLYTFFLGYARELTLCMLAFWSHEGVVFLDFLPSPHFITSFLFPCLGSTDALCPCSLPLWRAAQGSKLMCLELIHGLFIS